MITCLSDIDDNNPKHEEAVLSAVRNLGLEHLTSGSQSASDMFYSVWDALTSESCTVDQAEATLCEEINFFLS